MTTNTHIETLGAAKYISLTTFRKDGTAVATPVWLVRDGTSLMVITDPTSGKAKRLRNNPAVLVSPCDMRGRVKPEAISVPGTVAFQDEVGTSRAMDLIRRRYGLMGRIFTWMNERKARKAGKADAGHVGLTITLDPAS
ncbi:MAG: PPOX class F420-dependent oxidoreductase [Actinomycetes bacterium]